ncbi:MAG: TRCF domain-containing protein, partial [Verrucomicrobiales bacterium]
ADQHYQTFRQRMSDFPIKISTLTRYRSPAEQRETVALLASGGVDIVIGTHRLLSKQVKFKDLGLVVIDEEQRFGVKQKEEFKERWRFVDILTLSATPIPRTLYLSLMGVREMSSIDTPPNNRRPIATTICPYDEKIIRTAIEKELARQGQVFFLHNRVATIRGMQRRIEDLVPGVRVRVGHGQMEDEELEDVMRRFINHEFDVLVCTTIIESGVDIPNANTIIIDRADRFGLADLYQIRGRVGRADRRAYAYLMLPPDMLTVGNARKRINAIKQYSSLGAGFKIAMRDLEIRGAGNLLGTQQSGQIAAIGFDLYCQLLKQSVSSLKGETVKGRVDTPLHVDFVCTNESDYLRSPANSLPAFIPASYMPEARLRITAYRELAEASEVSDLDALRENWTDRFGKIPDPVEFLLQSTEIKILASQKGFSMVELKDGKLKVMKKGNYVQINGKFPRLCGANPGEWLESAKDWVEGM